jgi:hypothetical protein
MNNMLAFKVREEDRRDGGQIPVLIAAGQLICIPILMIGAC